MRNISCFHTTDQVLARTKTVTRRLAWRGLKPGTMLRVVRKSMGMRKGDRVEKLAVVRVVSVRREWLWEVTREDVVKEGFPDWSRADFIEFFTGAMGVGPSQEVTRIEWEYADEAED